jgi:hypothetical protein
MINSEDFNSILNNEFSLVTIIDITEGDEEFKEITLKLIYETLNKDILHLSSLISPLRIELIKKFAHKIKPNFELIGLNSLFDLCHKLEHDQLSENEYKDLINLIYNSKPIVLGLLENKTTIVT